MAVMNDNIATFTNSPVKWVDNWFNIPVKKVSTQAAQAAQVLMNLPEFMEDFFINLPIDQFDKSLKLNRDWYKECKRELAIRRNICIKKYWETVEKYKEAKKTLDECWEN